MPRQRVEFAPAGHVPELDGFVPAGGGEQLPSSEKATELTKAVCPFRVRISRPLSTSQSLTVVSALPEASTFPSGENATELTQFVCPLRVRSSRPVVTSQSLIVASALPEASTFPSGEKATIRT